MRSSVYETDQYNHVDGLLVTVGLNVSFLVVLFFLSLWHTCRTSKISTKTFSLAHFGARKLIAWSHTFLSAIDPQAAAISRRRQPLSSLAIASHYRR